MQTVRQFSWSNRLICRFPISNTIQIDKCKEKWYHPKNTINYFSEEWWIHSEKRYTVEPQLSGNLAYSELSAGPVRFRLTEVPLYFERLLILKRLSIELECSLVFSEMLSIVQNERCEELFANLYNMCKLRMVVLRSLTFTFALLRIKLLAEHNWQSA